MTTPKFAGEEITDEQILALRSKHDPNSPIAVLCNYALGLISLPHAARGVIARRLSEKTVVGQPPSVSDVTLMAAVESAERLTYPTLEELTLAAGVRVLMTRLAVAVAEVQQQAQELERWKALGAKHDLKPRDPGCKCHQEEGDSPCPVHLSADDLAVKAGCWCRDCEDVALAGLPPFKRMTLRRFIVCPTCGNKRCPRAKNHAQDCSRSNAPGQLGSDYP